MRTVCRQAAFTLIEVMIALAIFGIMSALAYATLSQSLTSSAMLHERMARLQDIQWTVNLLAQDFTELAPRPIRDPLGNGYSPVLRSDLDRGGFAVEMTRGGWRNPSGLPRGTQQRVAYRLEDGKLVRYYWNVLDRTVNTDPVAMPLLDDIERIDIRFMQDGGSWSEQWPAENQPGAVGIVTRPRAVEFIIRLTDQGDIRRLIEVTP